jgi:hypothetical protein
LVAKQILAYLARNPHARDTLDGIRQWWLLNNASSSPRDVEEALRELVKQGHVFESAGPDGNVHYSAAPPGRPLAGRDGPPRGGRAKRPPRS